jgi:hypothetical protein
VFFFHIICLNYLSLVDTSSHTPLDFIYLNLLHWSLFCSCFASSSCLLDMLHLVSREWRPFNTPSSLTCETKQDIPMTTASFFPGKFITNVVALWYRYLPLTDVIILKQPTQIQLQYTVGGSFRMLEGFSSCDLHRLLFVSDTSSISYSLDDLYELSLMVHCLSDSLASMSISTASLSFMAYALSVSSVRWSLLIVFSGS